MRFLKPLLLISFLILTACIEDSDSIYQSSPYSGGNQTNPGDRYTLNIENPFVATKDQALSSFSVDADGASYANSRRFILHEDQLPPVASVRTEEFMNYFDLNYPYTNTNHPINLNGEISTCPWDTTHKLLRIGLQGKPISPLELKATNYVFLIDVSGSMSDDDKLPLLQRGFELLVDQLRVQDRVAIVSYAGSSSVVLSSTPGDNKVAIRRAIRDLTSAGGTAGSQGIITAYNIAEQNFISNGNNRLILGTDGDFNIGISNQDSLVSLIEKKRDLGIFLTVLGVGRGNLNDAMMEQLANNGNGNYEYIDKLEQLEKVFIHEASKFHTVAKDVKVQVEFDPKIVKRYRLIGYENRKLTNAGFSNDSVDAGEIGADQNITALYEIETTESAIFLPKLPACTIRFRYKEPADDVSKLTSLEVKDLGSSFEASSEAMRFVACAAAFSLQLRNSDYKGNYSYQDILAVLANSNMADPHGFKAEFEDIVQKASSL